MKRCIERRFGWMLALLCVLVLPAQAEQADRSKPANIEADSVQMDDLHKTSLYQGDVILQQGTLMVRADKMTVNQDADGFNQATAYGNPVYFRQKQDGSDEYLEGWADRVDMDNRKNTILMTGNARLKKGADEMHASSMLYNTATQQFWAKRSETSPTQSGSNRVRTAIFPKTIEKNQPDSGVSLQGTQTINSEPSGHE